MSEDDCGRDEALAAARSDPRQMDLPLTREELEADAQGSFYEALRALRDRCRAGEDVPRTGYFAREGRR